MTWTEFFLSLTLLHNKNSKKAAALFKCDNPSEKNGIIQFFVSFDLFSVDDSVLKKDIFFQYTDYSSEKNHRQYLHSPFQY